MAITIKAPNFKTAEFEIIGTAPLVIHRFSLKAKREMAEKVLRGSSPVGKKKHEPTTPEAIYNAARYISRQGWDGFNAASIRNAMISACRLCNFKMTMAKMSLFVLADGVDREEPQIPLIRIFGEPVMQDDITRVGQNDDPCPCYRPAYHDWRAKLRVRFDSDQFTATDVSNLMMRVGMQVGIGEGRPDSPNSAGMGWGTFELKA